VSSSGVNLAAGLVWASVLGAADLGGVDLRPPLDLGEDLGAAEWRFSGSEWNGCSGRLGYFGSSYEASAPCIQ